jgi:quercetin 2,3-dioxygenase
MDRKEFLRKGLLGTGVFVSTAALGNVLKNDIDELKGLEVLGFNHIPNTNSKIMDNTILHKADTRGDANHVWLHSRHTFSFANYHNPERMHFGVLRVLNDDMVAPGMGFGTHPHNNMEIISIPLEGDLDTLDGIERAVQTFERRALPDVERSLLAEAQKRFVADYSPRGEKPPPAAP